MSTDLALPVELIFQVIDSLEGDADALKAFSLISRSGLPRCREYLHNNVYIRAGDPAVVNRQLARYSPSLLRDLVRQLRIEALGCSEADLCNHVAILVIHFPFVRHIAIGSHPDDFFPVEPLSRTTPYPEHISLRIEAIDFTSKEFYRLLKSISGLSRLELNTVNWNWGEENWNPGVDLISRNVIPDLRSLSVSNCMRQGQFLRWLCTGSDRLVIDHMGLREGAFPPEINIALAAMGRFLVSLELYESTFLPETMLALNGLTALRSLCIGSNNATWTISCLSLASLPSLTQISFIFRVTSFHDFIPDDWINLDKALSTSYPRLSDFSIQIMPWSVVIFDNGGRSGSLFHLQPPVFRAIELAILARLSGTWPRVACRVNQFWDEAEE